MPIRCKSSQFSSVPRPCRAFPPVAQFLHATAAPFRSVLCHATATPCRSGLCCTVSALCADIRLPAPLRFAQAVRCFALSLPRLPELCPSLALLGPAHPLPAQCFADLRLSMAGQCLAELIHCQSSLCKSVAGHDYAFPLQLGAGQVNAVAYRSCAYPSRCIPFPFLRCANPSPLDASLGFSAAPPRSAGLGPSVASQICAIPCISPALRPRAIQSISVPSRIEAVQIHLQSPPPNLRGPTPKQIKSMRFPRAPEERLTAPPGSRT